MAAREWRAAFAFAFVSAMAPALRLAAAPAAEVGARVSEGRQAVWRRGGGGGPRSHAPRSPPWPKRACPCPVQELDAALTPDGGHDLDVIVAALVTAVLNRSRPVE